MPGPAESAPEAGGLADLASFLTDKPDEGNGDENEETTAKASPDKSDTEDDANAQQEDSEDDSQEESDEEDAEETPAPERKIAVTIKAKDGTETNEEVSEKQLIEAYERQREMHTDYTRKTQSLSEREGQAVEILKSKHDEFRQHYLQQAEVMRAAVAQMAGLKTEQEMAQLANSDPAAWVAENQRQQSVLGFVGKLDQKMAEERNNATQQTKQANDAAKEAMYARAWAELAKDKIDRSALTKIYGDVEKGYGFKQTELAEVYDPRLVRVFRDVAAYRDLQTKSKEVSKQILNAPRLPNKQTETSQTRQDKQLNDRFKGGRGKLADLAKLLA